MPPAGTWTLSSGYWHDGFKPDCQLVRLTFSWMPPMGFVLEVGGGAFAIPPLPGGAEGPNPNSALAPAGQQEAVYGDNKRQKVL